MKTLTALLFFLALGIAGLSAQTVPLPPAIDGANAEAIIRDWEKTEYFEVVHQKSFWRARYAGHDFDVEWSVWTDAPIRSVYSLTALFTWQGAGAADAKLAEQFLYSPVEYLVADAEDRAVVRAWIARTIPEKEATLDRAGLRFEYFRNAPRMPMLRISAVR